MTNRRTEAAWAYHDGTKHSYASIRADRHELDWENQPLPFKIYADLPAVPLPQHLASTDMPALEAIAIPKTVAEGGGRLTFQTLAEIFFLSAGVTRRRRFPGGEMLFRAAACTGALYHIDLYLVCGDLEELAAGVYHFGPQDFTLRRLRAGDYRQFLTEAAGGERSLNAAPCAVVSASTFWRNAWKYRARAYRHGFWDNGTIAANLLAAAAARGIAAELVIGFVDAEITRLLGLDGHREAPLSIVALGSGAQPAPGALPPEPLRLNIAPLSRAEVDYPSMRAMHEASSLLSRTEVRVWREQGQKSSRGESPTKATSQRIPLMSPEKLPADSLEQVILRRGSTREFARVAIEFGELSAILDRATRGISWDVVGTSVTLNDIYLIVNAVEGLAAGAYRYHHHQRELELLHAGDFRRDAGELGLGQQIPEDCSVNIYFLTDLHDVLTRFGNRGYRAAQLEASIMGGKIYLGAYAQRLGASGLTFFDDDVTEFFSPDAAGKSVMFLIALGRSKKRATVASEPR